MACARFADHQDVVPCGELGQSHQVVPVVHQADGVVRMERLLDEHGGVLVADEVGLGKTYLAGEVIYRTANINRQRVLIVAPAALKTSMWEPFLREHDFSRWVQVYSYEEVRNRLDLGHPGHHAFMQEIDPVLIKNSLDDRVAYLTDFVNFTSHDSDVITAIAPHVNAVIPSMVDDLYSKLFEFDITKKVFMTRNHVSYVLRSPPYHHL